MQINGPQVVAQAFGSGALNGPGGKKVAFTVDVDAYAKGGGHGAFQLNDQANHQKIDLNSITSTHAPAGAGCGSIAANSAHSFELTGSGKFNGANGRTIHVCVQDNADPGKGLDRLHVDCPDCPYSTASPNTNELLNSGNVKVNSPPPPPPATPGSPSVVTLDPVLGVLAGVPATLTATVYDATGQPVPNAAVSLTGIGMLPLSFVTNTLGQAILLLVPADNLSSVASTGGVDSNPVFFEP